MHPSLLLFLLPLVPLVQSFHDRLKAEQDILETYDVEESCKYITVRWHAADASGAASSIRVLLPS